MKSLLPTAAYIHIPFCKKKCGYCDFVSYAGKENQIASYMSALQEELQRTLILYKEESSLPPLRSVYFGGGTPNSVPARDLTAILDILRENIGFHEDVEITVEANPAVDSFSWLEDLRQNGFNRLSVGLQAAQPELLKRLGRIHSPSDFLHFIQNAKRSGWQNISGDIMLGLPGQSLTDIEQTLEFLIEPGLQHVSFYSLIIEPGTPFAELYGKPPGVDLLPPEEEERAQYHFALNFLRAHGYAHYEISNAAKSGFASRHNLTYWSALPYFGFGCGARSYLDGRRYANTDDLAEYIAFYQNPGADLLRTLEEEVNEAEAEKEFFLLGLRVCEGVRISDFIQRFGHPLPVNLEREIQRLVQRGLLHRDADTISLTELGIDLANQVFMAFV